MLDISHGSGKPLTVRWLDIRKSQWMDELMLADTAARIENGNRLWLITPAEEGYWAVRIQT